MAAVSMNADARKENVRALMRAAGIEEADAEVRLGRSVLITCAQGTAATLLARELYPVLSRTLDADLEPPPGRSYAVEIVIGCVPRRTRAPAVYVALTATGCHITAAPAALPDIPDLHPLLILMCACYVAGRAVFLAVGGGIQNVHADDMVIAYRDLIPNPVLLDSPINVGESYLAGAGAIGNGFLWAARHVRLAGRLHIVDDDTVSAGNLQRQIWFVQPDLGTPKATTLATRAQPFMAECELVPSICRLQEHPNRNSNPAWLPRLIVAVDSRNARRRLQNELPGEVFDASTTGVEEIVLHYNRQPTEQACMACVYSRDAKEVSHEQAVAAQLGVDPLEVRLERITPAMAEKIVARNTGITPNAIIGLACDTLYKQLCGSGRLRTTAGEAVIAPFAFVSVLAGALLLADLVMSLAGHSAAGNDWRVSPWHSPDRTSAYLRPRRTDCECCGREVVRRAAADIWSPEGPADFSRKLDHHHPAV